MEQNQQHTPLSELISERIISSPDKKITFYDFMQMALYEDELGYYTKDKSKIGKSADFYTSSSVGPIFGQVISNSFIEMLPYTTSGDSYSILEIGGGDGRFARDVLDNYKNNHKSVYQKLKYYMLETSPYHKNLQANYLSEHIDRVEWLDNMSDINNFEGIIFSNELIDAFPVHKVKKEEGILKETYVTFNEATEQFEEKTDQLSNDRLENYFTEQGIVLKEGQTAEVNLAAIDWVKSIGDKLKKGYVVTIDYGYLADELYASYRHNGTLMCYYRHIANENPYINIGEQDITAHVNFSILIENGHNIGLDEVWFTTQSNFLLNSGILSYLQEVDINEKNILRDEALRLNRAIRQLVTPGEMGETFKILIQQKAIEKKDYKFLKNIWEQYGMDIKL